jgi:hypothetical protein
VATAVAVAWTAVVAAGCCALDACGSMGGADTRFLTTERMAPELADLHAKAGTPDAHLSRPDSAIQDGQALLLRSLTVSAVATEHRTGTHPPQEGAGIPGAAALAVTGPPASR